MGDEHEPHLVPRVARSAQLNPPVPRSPFKQAPPLGAPILAAMTAPPGGVPEDLAAWLSEIPKAKKIRNLSMAASDAGELTSGLKHAVHPPKPHTIPN